MAKRLQKKKGVVEKLKPVITFFIVFNLLAIPLYISLYTNFSFEPLQVFDAKISAASIKALGYDASSNYFTINLSGGGANQKIDISWDSTGWKSMYAIFALILATPISRLSRRLKAGLIGIGIVFVLNYLRITTTILISTRFGFNLFDIVHTVLWREGLILAIVGIWLLWLNIEKHNFGKS
ncbi:MAG: exosortase/archaeosortase family protein [Candidatus Aenigmarchaeota archaeon]|nr:exosortase/archaeosortase family protein [Candidatus Aenigmarchaeota archaeon]